MFFFGRTVLSMMDDALYVYRSSSDGVEFIEAVPWNRDGFIAYVTGLIQGICKGAPVFVVNDMVEQYYRKERVFTAGIGVLDKKSMVERKLAMVFPSYSVRAAVPLNEKIRREDSKMASDVYLFAAIASSDQLASTVSAVTRSSASSKGVSLLPLESVGLVDALVKKLVPKGGGTSKWSLLLGQQRNGNLRQIVVKDGDIALTRMTQITEDTNPEVWAGDVIQEFQSTMNYLSRLGFQAKDGLDVVLIAPNEEAELVRRSLEGRCAFYNATTAQAAKLLGLKTEAGEGERYADLLHMAWLVKKFTLSFSFPVAALAPVAQARMAANGASAFLAFSFLFMVYSSAADLMSVVKSTSELSEQKSRLARLEKDYKAETTRMSESGVDLPLVQAISKTYQDMSKNELDLLSFVQQIGGTLTPETPLGRMSVSVVEKRVPLQSMAKISRRVLGTSTEKESSYEAHLILSFPEDVTIESGNRSVGELRTRLRKALPDDEIEIAKTLDDRQYVANAGSDRGQILQDRVAEILIKGGAKP